jgi:hypothetical protein
MGPFEGTVSEQTHTIETAYLRSTNCLMVENIESIPKKKWSKIELIKTSSLKLFGGEYWRFTWASLMRLAGQHPLALPARWRVYVALFFLSIHDSSCHDNDVGMSHRSGNPSVPVRHSTTTTACFLSSSGQRHRTADFRLAERFTCARKQDGGTTILGNAIYRPGVRQAASAQSQGGRVDKRGIEASIVDEILNIVYETNDGHCTSDEEDYSIDKVAGE